MNRESAQKYTELGQKLLNMKGSIREKKSVTIIGLTLLTREDGNILNLGVANIWAASNLTTPFSKSPPAKRVTKLLIISIGSSYSNSWIC